MSKVACITKSRRLGRKSKPWRMTPELFVSRTSMSIGEEEG